MEVHDIVQETGIKTIPKEKKGNVVVWGALQIADKCREAKGKGEKERYTHLNEDLQRKQGEIRNPSSVINAKK